MRAIDGVRCFQAVVRMRDGVRLKTFVLLPDSGNPVPAGDTEADIRLANNTVHRAAARIDRRLRRPPCQS